MQSIKPEIVVIGVRISCETLDMKLLRISSSAASDFAMLLKARASSVTSSLPTTGTRTLKLPSAKLFAARLISFRGLVTRSVMK